LDLSPRMNIFGKLRQRSNHAMQPTAGRRTASPRYMKILPRFFTRALASRS
jgi:hypothetical protein